MARTPLHCFLLSLVLFFFFLFFSPAFRLCSVFSSCFPASLFNAVRRRLGTPRRGPADGLRRKRNDARKITGLHQRLRAAGRVFCVDDDDDLQASTAARALKYGGALCATSCLHSQLHLAGAAPYDTWPRVDASSSEAQLARQERESVNCKQMVSAGGRSLQAGGSGANKVPAVV